MGASTSTERQQSEGEDGDAPLSDVKVPSSSASLGQSEDAPVLKGLDDDEDSVRVVKNSEKPQSSRRYFVYAIFLWTLQLILVISLKRFGYLEKSPLDELNEAFEDFQLYFNVSIESFTSSTEKKNVGYELKMQGATATYPIVFVPGFVTSGLEVWGGQPCAKGFFRQRIWAALSGAQRFLVERDCWKEHMRLDPYTGSDPENIRVRASEGFGATDYFMANYWVFGKMIQNLAEVGYDPSNMVMQPYDWRLPFHLLEERDGFFTNLKARIEAMHKTSGKKVVLATHSMGAMVIRTSLSCLAVALSAYMYLTEHSRFPRT